MTPPTLPVMLVDDETSARRALRDALGAFPFVSIVGEAASVADATRIVNERQPALILLDVNLPVRSGFELLPHVPPTTHVIFVTAFDTYAVRAFEFNVIDYLLKPLQPERLKLALHRVCQNRLDAPATPRDDAPALSGEVVLQADGDVHVVPVSGITFIKAVGNYTQVNLAGGRRVLVRRSMDSWLEQLPRESFCRPHRSLIVNLRLMKGVLRRSRDLAELRFSGSETSVAVGRRASLLLQRTLKHMAMPRTVALG